MRFGILLPSRGLFMGEKTPDPGVIMAMAEAAEAMGADSVWIGDSLSSKPRLEPLTALAAIASRTSRVRLGTAVLLPALRPPVPLTHIVGTVDYFSRGRLVLAMGAGGVGTEDMKREWAAAGVPFRQRAGRLEETVRIMRLLWSGKQESFQGKYFQFEPLTLRPLPWRGRVPLLLACHNRGALEIQIRRAAALGDGIISIGGTPEEYGDIKAQVWDMAQQGGRDVSEFEAVFYITVNIGADAQAARTEAEDFLKRYYGVLHPEFARWGPFDRPEAVADAINAYGRTGADTVIVRFASFRLLEQLGLFSREVLPRLEVSHPIP